MRLHIVAVGRLRAGPERDLIDDYLIRFDRTGRALNLGPSNIIEIEDKKNAGPKAEAALLLKAIPENAHIIALDERGTVQTSPKFAKMLGALRDDGARNVAFVIGGADGLGADIIQNAHRKMSFGSMVWPHMLARVMLAEQLYRAASILAGSPYHRE